MFAFCSWMYARPESKFELSIHSLKKYKNWWIVHSQAPLFEHILNGVLSSIERAIPHIRIHLIHFVREEAPARDVFCRWILIPNEVIWTKETTIWLHLTTIIKHTSYRHSCWDSHRIWETTTITRKIVYQLFICNYYLHVSHLFRSNWLTLISAQL